MTDPIADLLTRIRNGQTAKHEAVQVPKSRMKLEIVKILRDEGYIDGYEETTVGDFPFISVRLRYDHAGTKAMSGLVRVSRPGRRVYCGKAEIPKVLNGLGITILSTSRGVMSGGGCRKAGVGGEILCNIW
jgi:small subunit ribosomal protein S8